MFLAFSERITDLKHAHTQNNIYNKFLKYFKKQNIAENIVFVENFILNYFLQGYEKYKIYFYWSLQRKLI